MKKNAELRIEKGVPIPKKARAPSRFRLDELEVGDSIFIPCADANEKQLVSNAYSSFNSSKWANLRKLILRTVDGGVRLWRIK